MINDLFFGNLNPSEHPFETDEKAEMKRLTKECEEARKNLAADLTQHQIELFCEFSSANDKLSSASELDAFKIGFSVACQLLVEALSY